MRAWWWCLSVVLVACGGRPHDDVQTLASDAALARMRREELEAYGPSLERAMRRAGIGREAIEARIHGAAQAKILAERLGPAWLEKAESWLELAAADGSDPDARCRAVESLVRFERETRRDEAAAREALARAEGETSEACRARLASIAGTASAEPTAGDDEPTPTSHVTSSPAAPLRVILLDPGHGGDEHGARVDGVRESHLALDITRRAAMILSRALPTTRILMTRESDVDITLEQRAQMAQGVDADLFVSVHLNAADEPVDRGGVTTFVLDTEGDEAALRLAARENGTEVVSVTGMQRLLAGLHRERQAAASRVLADSVHGALLARARREIPWLPDRGVKSAMFYVLVGAEMPAILVEASFMTRPDELAQLRTIRYRQALAEGIAAGILRYAEATSGPNGAPPSPDSTALR